MCSARRLLTVNFGCLAKFVSFQRPTAWELRQANNLGIKSVSSYGQFPKIQSGKRWAQTHFSFGGYFTRHLEVEVSKDSGIFGTLTFNLCAFNLREVTASSALAFMSLQLIPLSLSLSAFTRWHDTRVHGIVWCNIISWNLVQKFAYNTIYHNFISYRILQWHMVWFRIIWHNAIESHMIQYNRMHLFVK